MVTGALRELDGRLFPQADHNMEVLGPAVVVVGAGFVLLGVNGMASASGLTTRTGSKPKDSHPVAGAGSDRPASTASRRAVAAAWIVLGVAFMVAAFTHQVP